MSNEPIKFWDILLEQVRRDEKRAETQTATSSSANHRSGVDVRLQYRSERAQMALELNAPARNKARGTRPLRPRSPYPQAPRPTPQRRPLSAAGQAAIQLLNAHGASLNPDALTAAALSRAWRRLAFRYHPDRAGAQGALVFQRLNRAVQDLSKECNSTQPQPAKSTAA
jgi:hypothetical protein